MSLISNSLKKLQLKKEGFRQKMLELRNLDVTDNTNSDNIESDDSDSSCLDCSINVDCNLNDTFTTVPKQVYDQSKDIVCQAFNSEVLLPTAVNSILPDIADSNADSHEKSSYFFNPIDLNLTESEAGDVSDTVLPFPYNLNRDEFSALIACIPTLNERCSSLESSVSSLQSDYSTLTSKHVLLENKYSELDGKYNNLQSENILLKRQLALHRSHSRKKFNEVNQYSRRNSLLAHRLRKVPTNLHGTKFSQYVAAELRKSMPGLSISHHDIDTSHILYYEYGNFSRPVVIIKFVSRDLRNDILHYGNKENADIFFTEHLTLDNRKLFEEAQRRFKNAWTEQCRIFVIDRFGHKKEIMEEADLDIIQSLPDLPSSKNHQEANNTSANAETFLNESPPTFSSANNNRFPNNPKDRRKYTRNKKSSFQHRRNQSQQFHRNSNQTHSTNYTTPLDRKVPYNPASSTAAHQTTHPSHSVPDPSHGRNVNRVMQSTNLVNYQAGPSFHNVPASNPQYMQNNYDFQTPPFAPSASNVNNVPLNNQQPITHLQQPVYNFNNHNFGPRCMTNSNFNPRLPVINTMVPPPGFNIK